MVFILRLGPESLASYSIIYVPLTAPQAPVLQCTCAEHEPGLHSALSRGRSSSGHGCEAWGTVMVLADTARVWTTTPSGATSLQVTGRVFTPTPQVREHCEDNGRVHGVHYITPHTISIKVGLIYCKPLLMFETHNFTPVPMKSLNSLWPNDDIWWHRSGSKIIQIMASCLTSHLSEGNFTRDTSAINHWNKLENYLYKISFNSTRGQWVKLDMSTACRRLKSPQSLSGTSAHPTMATLVNIVVMNGWLTSFSFQVNRLFHSSDKALSDSWPWNFNSKVKVMGVVKEQGHMIDPVSY